MTLQELREFKKKLLDKYVKSKDKDIKAIKIIVDKLIKRKLEVENERAM